MYLICIRPCVAGCCWPRLFSYSYLVLHASCLRRRVPHQGNAEIGRRDTRGRRAPKAHCLAGYCTTEVRKVRRHAAAHTGVDVCACVQGRVTRAC